MRAWLMDSYEGVEKLRLADVADPEPAAGEVVLKMLFAALNPADAFLSQALYPAKPPLPHILGRDGVGEVVAVGEGVDSFKIGDRAVLVTGNTGVERWGTLAEKTVASASELVPVPWQWKLEEVAGAPLVHLTGWQALTQWSEPAAPPPAGSVVLITGASGGVGSAAVLLAKSMGATVVALSRGTQKAAQLTALGADFVFDMTSPQLRKQVLAALSPRRVDLVVDSVGGALFNDLVALLGYAGRISVVGRSGGPVPEFNSAGLLFRRNRIGGVSVGDYRAPQARADWAEIVRRLDSAGRRPPVDGVYPFAEVKAAFARLALGPMGKVVIQVAG